MKQETILLCKECLLGELETIWQGDEGWLVCPECNNIEGEYYELTNEENDEIQSVDYQSKINKLREIAEGMLISIKRIKQ